MKLALRYAVRSDVGLLREGNEDSAYAGPHLLAVADGMGGHAAGEVASAATITSIAALDVEHPESDLVGALASAVASANMRLQELIISDPATEGMGTTLTALLWSEGQAALCHIGDSRAYLLRNGQFYQITHDHTLVQSLVDEGKITEDDVATHPHRSLLLRALDGRTIAEPDLSVHETTAGDRYMLCSDGLSGVVTEQTLHQTLSSVWDPDKAAVQLIELAIKGGGPDNITCIVADVVDTQTTALPPTRAPVLAGAASNGAPAELRSGMRQSSPATRAMHLARTNPQLALPDDADPRAWEDGNSRTNSYNGHNGTRLDEDEPDTGRRRGRHGRGSRDAGGDGDDGDADYADGGHREARRRWPIVTTVLVLLVLVVGGGLFGGWQYVRGQYYVGVKDGNIAIFRGVNQDVAGISLSSLVERTNVPVSQVVSTSRNMISQTITSSSLSSARNTVSSIQQTVAMCRAQYLKLQTWQTENVNHEKQVLAFDQHKTKVRPGPLPAQPPYPDAADCAPPSAFGISASTLPAASGSQTGGASPAASPSPAASTRTTPTPGNSA